MEEHHAAEGADQPAQVGEFRIVEVLGSGGMGTVYLAEQEQPVRRRVALKILNRSKMTERGIARFEAERQALALMGHPSIAAVYDAGTTEDGRPYFAMEVVRGQAIDQYCDGERLGVRERVGIVLQVCDGVQHAHQRLVIHRDLKPSNVLVSLEDGRPVPKIIDFGIAKGTEQPLVDRDALKTVSGLPIGTPMYMSPEQIQGDDLDARVDVYALGVLLYQLLAGASPFDGDGVEPFQLMMRVLKEDPPRPSARLAALPDREQVAAARGCDARSLRRQLAGDLDAIIMKALEKDRRTRYGSAAELAADLRAHLEHRPVAARHPGLAYRAGRMVRRHTVAVLAVAALAVALVLGAAIATVGLVRASRARDAAVAAEAKASATLAYLRKVLSAADPALDGRQVKVVDLLERGSPTVGEDLAGQPQVEAAVRKTIGLVLLELGAFEQARLELERAVELQRRELGEADPETLHTTDSLARVVYKLGRYREAADIHRRVYAAQVSRLGAEDPTTLWTEYGLAKALDRLGEWQEAEALYRHNLEVRSRVLGPTHVETLITGNSLGLFLAHAGRASEAEALLRSNLDQLERVVGPEHPDTLRGEANLAEVLNLRGRYTEAEALSRQVVAQLGEVLGLRHPETLGASAQLAVALRNLGRLQEAEALDRHVLASRVEVLGAEHPDTLDSKVSLAQDLLAQGQSAEGEALLADAMRTARSVLPPGHWKLAEYERLLQKR